MSKRGRGMRQIVSSDNNLKPENEMDSEQGCSSEEEEVEKELADFSFEELHRARSSGFVSVTTKRDSTQNKHARANKNRKCGTHGLNLCVETLMLKGSENVMISCLRRNFLKNERSCGRY